MKIKRYYAKAYSFCNKFSEITIDFLEELRTPPSEKDVKSEKNDTD